MLKEVLFAKWYASSKQEDNKRLEIESKETNCVLGCYIDMFHDNGFGGNVLQQKTIPIEGIISLRAYSKLPTWDIDGPNRCP